MPNLNRVTLMGNLTRDVDLKFTPKGSAVADLGIAINDSYKASDGTIKETVTFVDVEVWGRTAENCKTYLSKGRPVFIEGSLKVETWEQDGQKRSKLKVKAMNVQFLGGGDRKDSVPATRPESTRPVPAIPEGDDIEF